MSLERELQAYVDGLPAKARARLAEVAARLQARAEEEVIVDLMASTWDTPFQVVAMTGTDEVIAGVVLGVRPREGLVLQPKGWLRRATFAQLTPVEIQGITEVEEKAAILRAMLARDRASVALAAFVAGLVPEERAKLAAAAARFDSPEAEPVIYADAPVFRDTIPPLVVACGWNSGRALSLVLLGAHPEESLILTREGACSLATAKVVLKRWRQYDTKCPRLALGCRAPAPSVVQWLVSRSRTALPAPSAPATRPTMHQQRTRTRIT